MTLKETIYDILLNYPETRNSDKKLIWTVWRYAELTPGGMITEEDFIKAPSPESCRRCRQALQRTDLLTGSKLIQPTIEVKNKRVKLSKEKGFSYQEGKAVFNPITNCYEI